jgi:hypothetical protein
LQNKNTNDIQIKVPKWNTNLENQLYDLLWNLTAEQKQQIKVTQVDGISKIRIDSNEHKETMSSKHLELKELPYNVIWDPEGIKAVLIKTNPEMKALLEDPKYTITWWDIYGSASFQRTWYKTKPELWLQNYKNIATVTNQTKWWDGAIDNTVKNPGQQVDGDASWVTNNPTLAYDRAASFIDAFYKTPNKVADWAKFDINYGVNGKSKAELIKQLWITNEITQAKTLEDGFKKWQYAILDLNFKKTEDIPASKEFDVAQQELAVWFQMGVVGEQTNVSNTPPWHPPVRLRKLMAWGWHKRGNIFKVIPCPDFS